MQTYNTSADVTTNATPSKTPERKKKRESSPLIEEMEAPVPAVTPEPSKKKSKKEKSVATPTPTAVEVEEEATEEKVGFLLYQFSFSRYGSEVAMVGLKWMVGRKHAHTHYVSYLSPCTHL